ncbi:hypothetical protein [Nitratireductor luteus]|uniref:hypothetical protein n=1 Tax=Nitratireductor luteus TaxID=2976980 RepID=UPI002240E101|nr:hypothetical protein [Nitratireductor luteus]
MAKITKAEARRELARRELERRRRQAQPQRLEGGEAAERRAIIQAQPSERAGVQRGFEQQAGESVRQTAQTADDLARLAARGATFGAADRIAGALPGGGGDFQQQRARTELARRNTGAAGTAAEIGGSAATLGGVFGLIGRAAPAAVSRLGPATATGAAVGTGEAAIRTASDEGRLPTVGEAGAGAAFGGAGGAAGQLIGRLATRGMALLRGGQNAPRTPQAAELRQQADALYQQAREAGVRIQPQQFKRAVDNIEEAVKQAGFRERLNPKTAEMIQTLRGDVRRARRAGGIDLEEIEGIRRIIAKDIARDEPRLANVANKTLRNWLNHLPDEGAGALKKARDLQHRVFKVEAIEEAMRSADLAASKPLPALKSAFRRIAKSEDFAVTFTKKEREAIERVVKASGLEDTLREARSLVGLAVGGAAGFTVGGPAGAVAVPAATFIGERVAGNVASRSAQQARQLISTGQPLPGPAAQPGAATFGQLLGLEGRRELAGPANERRGR